MENLKIRPYARLLTMLGDQLIKNETIALTELVKNSYDADADFCNVSFLNFNENYTNNECSVIEVADNGYGMSYDIITKHFLNPATPIKKRGKELRKSKKGRICQGEKGIGRFSMLKLGKKVTVFSKEEENSTVHCVIFNFENYDDEFLFHANKAEEVFLDQIDISYEAKDISLFDNAFLLKQKNKGTIIRIEYLKGLWDNDKIDDFEIGMLRFCPFEISDKKVVNNQDFLTEIFINNKNINYRESALKKIEDVIYNKALYKVTGSYNEEERQLIFKYTQANDKENTVLIDLSEDVLEERNSVDFKGITFYDKEVSKFFKNNKTTSCGNFKYDFYIFDFDANQNEVFGLSPEDKDIVRDHRIFLYRDDVRVQPYGAPNDDWLQIDRSRAKDKAGNMFSNDQIVGQIRITKNGNCNLKDKTSREGIIEDTIAFEQLSKLIKSLLSYIRIKLYQRFKFDEKSRKEIKLKSQKKTEININLAYLKEACKNNASAVAKVDELAKTFEQQENVYNQRLDIAERLAGVGLSVETASHDIMLTLERLRDGVHQINVESQPDLLWNIENIHKAAEESEGLMGLVYMKMKDLQQIFVSSKQRSKPIKVEEVIRKIQSIYAKAYCDKKITIEYIRIGKSPVIAKTIDAVLFQVFINLFDNSLYWLQFVNRERKVVIYLDGDAQIIYFTDNGIGVAIDDAPYIFEAFYSGKGDEGRGLGLYIAKKLLSKYKYDKGILTKESEKKQQGTNFYISFVADDVIEE